MTSALLHRTSALVGWALAVAAIAIGYTLYGWPGVFLAFTMIVFWLLLQFSRALRVMRAAATRPVGLVDSALGKRLPHPSPGAYESWEWHDSGGDGLVVDFARGRCVGTSLVRAPQDETASPPPRAAAAAQVPLVIDSQPPAPPTPPPAG